jgi:glycosyltransferase involved in cell wall biosynthesis
MKVLHSIGSLDQRSGGPLRAILDLSAMSVSLGLDNEILGFGPVRIPDNPLSPNKIHSLPAQCITSYIYSPDMKQWCRKNLKRFDGVMLHGLWSAANWTISRECLAAKIPYIVFPHGMLDIWSVKGQGSSKWIKKWLYWHLRELRVVNGSCAIFFTMSRELENAKKTFRLPEIHPKIVVPYGVVPPVYNSDVPPSAKVDQGTKRKVALFLGRVHPKKRPDLLIESWAAAKVGRSWRLVIAGPGTPEYLAKLADLARLRGIEDAVQFVGPVAGTDKRYLFQRASWFLLPSEQENFGIAVLEAASSGCAVAISDQVYLADELPKETEILPVKQEAWTHFMRERMIDQVWQIEAAARIRKYVSDKFSEERIGREWTKSINECLCSHSRTL